MASSLKIVLRKKANKDGSFPLAIRITKDRKSSFIYLGYSVQENQWDATNQNVKKTHPNSVRLNHLLLKKKTEANEKLMEMDTNHSDSSSQSIQKKIKPQQGVSFFAQAEVFISNLKKEGKYNRVTSEAPRLKHFKEFLENRDISFQEITVPLLNNFKAYLKSTRNIGERTIINHLVVIRTIYNQAVKSGIVDLKHYPFGKGKIVIKFPDSVKIGLTPEEISKLEQLDLSNEPYHNHARNLWLFSFYFAGMRVSDVLRLKWAEFQNERLFYSMGKNLKSGSLKVPVKALQILEQYKNAPQKSDLIFPELKVLDNLNSKYDIQRKTSYAVKTINNGLKNIAEKIELTKELTMHIARHSFGNISGDKIPIQMLQKLYRHSSVTTTIGYQANFIYRDADDALDSVVNF